MKVIRPILVATSVACLVLVASSSIRGDEEEGIPSFKTSKNRETKEFVSKIGSAIVRAARTKSQKIELDKYEYTRPKPGRTELGLKMTFVGLVTKQKYEADVTVLIDSSDKDKWEVLNIRYEDSLDKRTGALKHNDKNLQALIKKLNK